MTFNVKHISAEVSQISGLPVDDRSPSPSHHGPDPATRVQQGQLQTGTALGIQICYVGLLKVTNHIVVTHSVHKARDTCTAVISICYKLNLK